MTTPPDPIYALPPRAAPAGTRGRGSLAVWIVLTVVAVLTSWFSNFLASGQWFVEGANYDPRTLWGFAGLVAGFFIPFLLLLRGRYPLAVTLICAAAVLVLPTSALPAAVAVSVLLARRGGPAVWWTAALVYAASVWAVLKEMFAPMSLLVGIGSGDSRSGLPVESALPLYAPLIAAALLLPFLGVGVLRRALAQRDVASRRSVQLVHTAEVLYDRAARDRERQAAARAIHDTLASRLSAVSLNAGSLELTMPDADGESARAARAVRESAQAALDDLRHVVQVLRDPGAIADSGKTILDLRQLIDEAHAAGDPVRSSVLVDAPGSCPPEVAHAAYGVVQEGLSNARRHASGAPVTVNVHGAPGDHLTVSVVNQAPRGMRHPSQRGTGHGVLGMRERVLMVGGELDVGPLADGGYAVTARIPWR
jgi:signal transduction histidine kinase